MMCTLHSVLVSMPCFEEHWKLQTRCDADVESQVLVSDESVRESQFVWSDNISTPLALVVWRCGDTRRIIIVPHVHLASAFSNTRSSRWRICTCSIDIWRRWRFEPQPIATSPSPTFRDSIPFALAAMWFVHGVTQFPVIMTSTRVLAVITAKDHAVCPLFS